MSERWVPAVDHPLISTASAGLDSATPGGQRFHTWTGAVSEPCRAWARYSERRMIDTFSPAPASPAGMTYEKLWRGYLAPGWVPPPGEIPETRHFFPCSVLPPPAPHSPPPPAYSPQV